MTHTYIPENALVIQQIGDLRNWLKKNFSREAGIWIVSFKKGHACFVPYGDVRDEALCFGWIDSKSQRVDEDRTATWLSPRRTSSPWSGVNKRRVTALREAGRMTPMGEQVIHEAMKDGSWAILDEASALIVPDDLAGALEHEFTRVCFDALPPSKRRSMLESLALAKTAKTREARMRRIVEECLVLKG